MSPVWIFRALRWSHLQGSVDKLKQSTTQEWKFHSFEPYSPHIFWQGGLPGFDRYLLLLLTRWVSFPSQVPEDYRNSHKLQHNLCICSRKPASKHFLFPLLQMQVHGPKADWKISLGEDIIGSLDRQASIPKFNSYSYCSCRLLIFFWESLERLQVASMPL